MRIDTVPLECPCGALTEAPYDDLTPDCTVPCESCGDPLHWHACPDCGCGMVLPHPDARCPECNPVPRGAPPPPWLLAVPCPACGEAFNYLREAQHGARGDEYECPHCARQFRGRPQVALLVAVMVALMWWAAALYGLDVVLRGALDPVRYSLWGGMLWVTGLAAFVWGALFALGRTIELDPVR